MQWLALGLMDYSDDGEVTLRLTASCAAQSRKDGPVRRAGGPASLQPRAAQSSALEQHHGIALTIGGSDEEPLDEPLSSITPSVLRRVVDGTQRGDIGTHRKRSVIPTGKAERAGVNTSRASGLSREASTCNATSCGCDVGMPEDFLVQCIGWGRFRIDRHQGSGDSIAYQALQSPRRSPWTRNGPK